MQPMIRGKSDGYALPRLAQSRSGPTPLFGPFDYSPGCPNRCRPASDSDPVLMARCREKQRIGRWCCFLFFLE